MTKEIKQLYRDTCQKGLYLEARRLLDLLRNKRINLGYDDIDWYVGEELNAIGLKISQVTRRFGYVYQI